MNAANSERLLQHIRRLAGDPPGTPSDGELLRRYREAGDQTAFAALMRRHGPMVFSVCQSVLRQSQDAEDAFQATFLILMQKAGSVRQQLGLSGWLQRVAYRVALRARANSLRRQSCEAQTARSPIAEPSCDDLSWRELRSILHGELAALPERFRAPLVLCYLEGLTQEEAARRLDCTAATVKGRLQRGREKLRRRLERRGVALTAALAAALTGQALAENAAPSLTMTTAATALAHGFLRPLLPIKLAMLSAVLLSLGVVAGGMALRSPSEPRPLGSGENDRSLTVAAGKDAVDLYGDPLPDGAVARMGSIQLRHAGQSDFVVLPDNKTILTAGGRVVRFWDIASGRLVREVKLQGPFAPGRSATPSPDGKILAGLDQNKLVFWDIDSGKQIKTLPYTEENWGHIYFSPDSKTLIVGTYKPQVVLWDWQKGGKRRIELPLRRKMGAWLDSTFHSCVSPDGKYLAAQAGSLGFLCIYELASGRELQRLSCHADVSTFSPDSKRLIVSSTAYDKKPSESVIRVFDAASGKEIVQHPLRQQEGYFSLDISPDGKSLACGFSDRSCLLNLTTGQVLHRLPDRPIRLVFSPDGKALVAYTGYHLRVWDPATGKTLHDRPGDLGWTLAMAVSPDGWLLAAADWSDHDVALWDTASGRLLRQLPMKSKKLYIRKLAFSPDGKTLIAAQHEGFLQFWDIATSKEQRTIQLRDPNRPKADWLEFYQLHVSADGKRVSTLERIMVPQSYTRLGLWDAATGKILSQHALPAGIIKCAWTMDGRTVSLALNDGLTQMNVETGAVRFRAAGVESGCSVAASADDRLLAAEMKGKAAVGIWEAATGKEVATLATGPISHLALVPDDRHLVTTDDKSLRLWDLATGKERQHWPLPEANTIIGSDPVVTRLVLSPDGRRAFTALNDGTALVWDLQPALHRRKLLAGKSTDKELAAWWTDLAANDARRAYAAIWRLTETPEAAVRFFRQHLKPATDADLKAIRRFIADLDSDQFATREKAFQELAKLGPLAEPAFRQALEQKPPVETRRRIQLLLEKIDQQLPAGELLRLLRSVQVLENTGAEGQRLLRELAGGAERAWLTRAARVALARIDRPK